MGAIWNAKGSYESAWSFDLEKYYSKELQNGLLEDVQRLFLSYKTKEALSKHKKKSGSFPPALKSLKASIDSSDSEPPKLIDAVDISTLDPLDAHWIRMHELNTTAAKIAFDVKNCRCPDAMMRLTAASNELSKQFFKAADDLEKLIA